MRRNIMSIHINTENIFFDKIVARASAISFQHNMIKAKIF